MFSCLWVVDDLSMKLGARVGSRRSVIYVNFVISPVPVEPNLRQVCFLIKAVPLHCCSDNCQTV